MSDKIEIIATESASTVHIINGAGSESVVAIEQSSPPETLEVFGKRGEQGIPGPVGPSGLQAPVSTDFSLIYKLST